MTATTAITVKEPRLQKTAKERNLQRKRNRVEGMIAAQNNQSSQQLQASAATSMRNWNKHKEESKQRRKSKLENNNDAH